MNLENGINIKSVSEKFRIEVFNPKEASEELWRKYFDHDEEIFKERKPNDPYPPRDYIKKFMLDPDPNYDIFRWLTFSREEPEKLIGAGIVWYQNEKSADYEGVKHKAYVYLNVNKNYRRQGIATEFLKTLIAKAKEKGKTILRAEVSHESAVAFCKKLGGTIVAERSRSRLYLSDVDWIMMEKWRTEGQRRAAGVTIETFQEVPEKDLQEYCKLYTETANQAPAEDFAGPMIVTPEKRRGDEKFYKGKGYTWITMITREPDGVISGLTEIFHNPEEPYLIEQEMTGVKEEYRGRGLGKWLKAEMIFCIKEKYPEAKYLETGNNEANAPMLSINNRMGYKRHLSETFFEFDLEDLCKKLGL